MKKNEVGRPTKYSTELAISVSERIGNGERVISICDDIGISRSVFYNWLREHQEFMDMYIRAREARGEKYNDDIEEIVEQCRQGLIDTNTARVIIDARKWQASKFYPKMFGDKTQLEHTGEVNINPLRQKISKWSDEKVMQALEKINKK